MILQWHYNKNTVTMQKHVNFAIMILSELFGKIHAGVMANSRGYAYKCRPSLSGANCESMTGWALVRPFSIRFSASGLYHIDMTVCKALMFNYLLMMNTIVVCNHANNVTRAGEIKKGNCGNQANLRACIR